MTIQRILVIQTAFIGDVILATALVEKLHRQYPDATLDMLVRKGNQGLLSNHPYLNKVFIWEKDRKYASLLALLRTIRATHYDTVINVQRFGATGFLTAFSKGKQRIGFRKNPFAFGFTERHEHHIGDGTHEVTRNHALVRGLTDDTPGRPKLYPSENDYAKVEPYKNTPYVCIAPTSVWFTKQYPPEKWKELIDRIPSAYRIYLLGGPSDREACEALAAMCSHAGLTNLAGSLNFLESAALIAGAVMTYANDSAPLHMASAMNAPVTAVFCSTLPAFGFGPLSDAQHVVETTEKLDCRPCGLHGKSACPKGHFRCATTIDTQTLVQVLPNS